MILKNRKLLIIGLTLLTTIFFTRCEKFEDIEDLKNSQTDVIINRISLDDFSSKVNLQQELKTVSSKFDFNKRSSKGGNIISNDSSFTILTNRIFETIKDSITTYSFLIKTPTDANSTFENFMITKRNDSLSYAIYKYKYHNSFYENFDYEISKQSINENQINTEDFSEYLNKITVEDDGCAYYSYWIQYSPSQEEHYGQPGLWSTPVLITCGFDNSGSNGGGSTGGQDNNVSNDNNTEDTTHGDTNDSGTDNNNTDDSSQNNGSGEQSSVPAFTVNEPENNINVRNAIDDFFNSLSNEDSDCLTPQIGIELHDFLQNNANPEITTDGEIIPVNIIAFAEQAIEAVCGGAGDIDFTAMQNIIDLSNNSPFNLDTSNFFNNISPLPNDGTPEAEKFNCIFRKLTKSPKFKSLFVDTFAQSENVNIKFEIINFVPVNGVTADGATDANILDVRMQTIKLDRGKLSDNHPLVVAQTIIHEALHAFINVKQVYCYNNGMISTGTNQTYITNLNQLTFDELLNNFSVNCAVNQPNQHRLMYNQMVNAMDEMLEEVFDDLVAPEDLNQVQYFYPPPNGEQHIFNWQDALHYINLIGLQEAIEYIQDNQQDPSISYLVDKYESYINNTINLNHNTCNQ